MSRQKGDGLPTRFPNSMLISRTAGTNDCMEQNTMKLAMNYGRDRISLSHKSPVLCNIGKVGKAHQHAAVKRVEVTCMMSDTEVLATSNLVNYGSPRKSSDPLGNAMQRSIQQLPSDRSCEYLDTNMYNDHNIMLLVLRQSDMRCGCFCDISSNKTFKSVNFERTSVSKNTSLSPMMPSSLNYCLRLTRYDFTVIFRMLYAILLWISSKSDTAKDTPKNRKKAVVNFSRIKCTRKYRASSIVQTFLLIWCCFQLTDAQRPSLSPESLLSSVDGSGWLLSNLLNIPVECGNEGSSAPCTFLLTCLIQGGTPVNKCGGSYIYTCCVPARSSRGTVSMRSDNRHAHPIMRHSQGPSLRHISSLFRDSPFHAMQQNSLPYPSRPSPEVLSPSRLPWRHKGWFSEEAEVEDETSRKHSPGLISLGPNVISSEDVFSKLYIGSSSQVGGGSVGLTPYNPSSPYSSSRSADNDIYYNEPECGVQKLSATQISKRIIGGNEARFAELPWQAHIRIAGYQCGGVLVNKHYVATAAHCVHKARLRDVTVHLGEFDTKDTGQHYEPYPKESFGVVEKRTHPNFKYMLTQPDRFDVAVLRLSRPVQYQPNILPICLPPPGDHFSGMMGVVAGWGKTDNSYGKTGTNILRKVNVPIIDNEECLRWHHMKNIDVQLHYEMFCAGHAQGQMDACLGDSGGPLVVNNKGRWTLAGITSAGFGCAVDHQPGIYHKVAITSGWIAANIRP